MSVMAQVYRLSMTAENLVSAKPGCYVFAHDYADHISGFLSAVDYETNEIEVCLFDATKLDIDGIKVIRQCIGMDEVYQLLQTALDANPDMRPEWDKVMAASVGPLH